MLIIWDKQMILDALLEEQLVELFELEEHSHHWSTGKNKYLNHQLLHQHYIFCV